MTLADLKQRVNDQRRDIGSTFVTDAEITRYLNEGARYLQTLNDWDFTQRNNTFSYTDGSNVYALSAVSVNNDFKAPIDLFYNYTNMFSFTSPEEFDVVKNYDWNVWAIDNSSLDVRTNFGSQTLTLDYYSNFMAKTSGGTWQQDLSSDTDITLVPDVYADVLVDYATKKIFRKEGKNDDYLISEKAFDTRLNALTDRYRSKRKDTQFHIKNPRDYGKINFDSKEDVLRQM